MILGSMVMFLLPMIVLLLQGMPPSAAIILTMFVGLIGFVFWHISTRI